MPQSRQLAAIMFTDIVGYTALMGSDDKKAFALLNKNRQLQKPIIESFGGRWIKEMGDGVIASFNTASDALAAAKKIQEACHADADFQLRIGIHLGEVVFENDDVFGDGVNIASRIESLGIAGSVLLSKAVRDQVKNNSDFQLDSLGSFDFKNVSEPMEVFALANPGFAVPRREEMQGKLKLPHKKSNTLKWIILAAFIIVVSFAVWFLKGQMKDSGETGDQSIAVLAFVDMSQGKDQEYFSDGLSENTLDLLAKVPGLKVIGRTSSFSFKGKNEDLRVIGEKLGAANILEGSVQTDGNTVRITAQLIRAADGIHLWSGKFDRELKDIFAIQDEISLAILKAVKVELVGGEKDAVLKKYTDNVEAYQLYLQGRFHLNKFNPNDFIKAIEYFDKAIAIDPAYAIAYADKAFCYMNLRDFGWMPSEKSMPQAIEAAQRAMQLDDQIAESQLAVGRIKLHWEWNIQEAMKNFENALDINPNSADAHVQLGFCEVLLGHYKEGMNHANMAQNLDPISILNMTYISSIVWTVGDYALLLEKGKEIIQLAPNFFTGHLWAGAAYQMLGRSDEALIEFKLAAKLDPTVSSLSSLGKAYALQGEKEQARQIIEEMKDAGAEIYDNYNLGLVYGSIGESDSAFYHLNKAIEDKQGTILWLKNNLSVFTKLSDDPRAVALYKKIGIPYP